MYDEDSPPMERPKGILSGETLPTVGLETQMGEQMAPGDDEHSDEETTHAEAQLEAMKAGDVEAFRNAQAAFVRACVRNYERGKDKP
jgi:hypothetical protein